MRSSAYAPSDRREFCSDGRLVCCWAVLLTLLTAWPLHAQTAASAPARSGEPGSLADQLVGIAGVRSDMTADELIDLALEAVKGQRLEEAQRILFVVSRQDQRNLRALQSLAYVYELQATAARANKADPNADKTAETYIDAAVAIYLHAAPIAVEARNFNTAEQMYNSVLRYRPANPDGQLGLARTLREMERSIQAVESYKTYLANPAARPDSLAQACLELGQIYRGQRYTNLALVTLEKGRALNPENAAILVELAATYQEMGKYDKAIEVIKTATDKAPNNPAYHDAYAKILLGQAQRPRAPGAGASAADVRALLEQARSEARQAINLSRQALRQTPDAQELLDQLRAYYGTYTQVLRAILGNDPANVSIRLELASAIQEQAAIAETLSLHRALEILQEGGDTAQRNIPYLEKLAELQFEVYRREAAAETCRKLLKLDPGNSTAQRILEQIVPVTSQPATPAPTR